MDLVLWSSPAGLSARNVKGNRGQIHVIQEILARDDRAVAPEAFVNRKRVLRVRVSFLVTIGRKGNDGQVGLQQFVELGERDVVGAGPFFFLLGRTPDVAAGKNTSFGRNFHLMTAVVVERCSDWTDFYSGWPLPLSNLVLKYISVADLLPYSKVAFELCFRAGGDNDDDDDDNDLRPLLPAFEVDYRSFGEGQDFMIDGQALVAQGKEVWIRCFARSLPDNRDDAAEWLSRKRQLMSSDISYFLTLSSLPTTKVARWRILAVVVPGKNKVVTRRGTELFRFRRRKKLEVVFASLDPAQRNRVELDDPSATTGCLAAADLDLFALSGFFQECVPALRLLMPGSSGVGASRLQGASFVSLSEEEETQILARLRDAAQKEETRKASDDEEESLISLSTFPAVFDYELFCVI